MNILTAIYNFFEGLNKNAIIFILGALFMLLFLKQCNQIDSLKRELDLNELNQFILKLDLKVANADFTESLIRNLVKSFKSDLSSEDKRNLINELSEDLGFEGFKMSWSVDSY